MDIHTVKLLAAIALIAGALPVMAAGDVAPEIHKMCLKAADYRGCVEAQKGTPEYVGKNVLPIMHLLVMESANALIAIELDLAEDNTNHLLLASQPGSEKQLQLPERRTLSRSTSFRGDR